MDLTSEQRAILALHLVPDIGPLRFKRLTGHFGSASAVLNASEKELCSVPEISSLLVRGIHRMHTSEAVDEEIALAERLGVRILTLLHPEYPPALRNLTDLPIVLYVAGKILPEDVLSIAIVGTRRPTYYGKSAAAHFARGCAAHGLTTVSGLARGIDTEAHAATLAAGGRTVAVLGNGLNRHYPPENRKLEDSIRSQGALLSEFPLNIDPDRCHFPRRNRIISGFALATVVVEADQKSGALITARYAAEQGKDVFAVPGSIFSPVSRGPHQLLKEGAQPALSADDFVAALAPLAPLLHPAAVHKDVPGGTPATDPREQKLLALIDQEFDGVSVDRLARELACPSKDLAGSLLDLEMKGLVKSLPGSRYIRVRDPGPA